ncbi:MAG TPA: bifunctional sulfate adenylyltransferase/adenylylsulfate kinase [Herpetosiphonaceae bacterium]|nr:bifunctional sulfate adenylyltransferase/adenylylsulfate kinase [Herpetosiphonaceae bacterium]
MDVPLIAPYGGSLVNLLVGESARSAAREAANRLPALQISDRSRCDLELLATGAFSPLDRFMGQADYARVLAEMRLASGHLFPIPIILPVDRPQAAGLSLGQDIALRDAKNNLLAIMTIEEIFAWDRDEAAERVFATRDGRHPLVAEMHRWGDHAISGRLQVLQLPSYYDFPALRLTPAATRGRLAALGRPDVVAFQTRNPLHRAHEELTKRAMQEIDGVLLLHPVVGLTKPGDVDHYTRVRTYLALAERYYDPGRILLALLPLAMRMAGPREALWHAIIRRNYGANALIVGRDHASPGLDSAGRPFYGPYDAQELVERHAAELGMSVKPFREFVYLPGEDRYEEISRIPAGQPVAALSGTQVRDDYLNRGRLLPAWFTRPEVARILGETYPPRHRQGACVWFTGLSSAGKSTIAEILAALLLAHGRQVTVLDGDAVRTHLSKGLGFSQEDRDTNVRRIGYVAGEVVRHGGIAIAAAISPYRATRNDVRALIGRDSFIEVFVNTPLEVCEQRDAKGLYGKARRGELPGFTGIDHPYERPNHAEIELDTVASGPEANARAVFAYLVGQGFLLG